MSTLYELTEDYMTLLEYAEDPEIDEETLKDTMEAVEGEIEVKAENYAKVIKQLEADTVSLKAEIDRLSARKKTLDNSITRIKKSLEEAMIATGKTKFKTELFSFGIQKNPASLKLADDIDFESIPMEFVIFPEPTIDKKAVTASIKAGAEYDWAHLEQSEGLRIR